MREIRILRERDVMLVKADFSFRTILSPCVYHQFINVQTEHETDRSLTVGSDGGIEPSSIPASASIK